jgi:hypothetical protein
MESRNSNLVLYFTSEVMLTTVKNLAYVNSMNFAQNIRTKVKKIRQF